MGQLFIVFIFKLVYKLLQQRIFSKVVLAHGTAAGQSSPECFFNRVIGKRCKAGFVQVPVTFQANEVTPVNEIASAAIAQLRKEKVGDAIESSFYQVR